MCVCVCECACARARTRVYISFYCYKQVQYVMAYSKLYRNNYVHKSEMLYMFK